MKKYIRTQEGNIYKRLFIDKAIVGGSHGCICDKDLNPIGETIIKESDDIEELCDEIVFFDNENKPHYKTQEPESIWLLGASLYANSLRFGIFTDKGLIYVAKLNDKGEWELL